MVPSAARDARSAQNRSSNPRTHGIADRREHLGDGLLDHEVKKRGRTRNAPKFDLRTQLFKMCGVDLTRIDGLDVSTALAVVSETGADMSRFPSDKHFASWMGLCPGTKITGGWV